MEDEYHFLNICPAYQEKRCSLLACVQMSPISFVARGKEIGDVCTQASSLLDYLEKEYRIKISRMSPNKIFMFLINPPRGNAKIQKLIVKHIFECFEKRKGEDGKK